MIDKSTANNFLLDLGLLLKENALEAKNEKEKLQKGKDYDYELGRLMAYNEVISLIQEQATAFGISLKDINLDKIDPDKDLL